MRRVRNVLKVQNNKKDFKLADKQLRETENNFIKNTDKLIYNFK